MKAWLQSLSARREPATSVRWVVVDCETSGLDPTRDRLLSVGAVGVLGQRIPADDRFDVVLRQAQPSPAADVLVHGIGVRAQASGAEPGRALEAFAGFAGAAPLAAFHADFDRAVLERAVRRHAIGWKGRWLDLAQLLPALFPARRRAARSLDAWLAEFGIAHPGRHDALADAYVSAQLLQLALAEAARQGCRTVGQVMRASAAAKWMGA